MRIAVFIKSTTFHKGTGGLETQNKVLCEGLAARGHDVTVFTPSREITENQKEESGVKYIFIPCIYRMLFAAYDKDNWYNRSYKEFQVLHEQRHFQAIISQSSAGIGIINRKHEFGIKITGISHGTIGGEMRTLLNSAKTPKGLLRSSKSLTFGLFNYFGRQRQYIHGCDAVVAVSSAVKKSIMDETFSPEDKITVIHNGMDPSRIQRKDWNRHTDTEPFKILYVGRIEESKGLVELLTSVKDLDGVFLNIVGEGPFLEEIRSLSRNYKMSQKVLFYGRLPYDKVSEIYSCNDVFILPTKRVEGFPMTLVESMFAGIPVIATDIGGNRDAVENGYNGFLLNNPEPLIIKDCILKLKNNRGAAKEMGLNGRIKAESKFTLENMLNNYEKVICGS